LHGHPELLTAIVAPVRGAAKLGWRLGGSSKPEPYIDRWRGPSSVNPADGLKTRESSELLSISAIQVMERASTAVFVK